MTTVDEGIKCIFTKLKGGENVRTKETEGVFFHPPTRGQGFVLWSDGLEFGMRMIYTSDVDKINKLEKGLGGWIIDTVTGSRYEIKIVS